MFFIIGILILIILCLSFLLYDFYKKKDNQFLNKLYDKHKEVIKDINLLYDNLKYLQARKKELETSIDTQLSEQVEQYKKQKFFQADQEYDNYTFKLNQNYESRKADIENKIFLLQQDKNKIQSQLNQIKQTYNAAVADKMRQIEKENKWIFYRIQISDEATADIEKLQEWKLKLHDPSIVSKVIWSTYILKPTNDLCKRVLGTSENVCGIYKITNHVTNEVYIGQSVNVADRWKNHIKCGLGIDASATNKLYNNMQHTGVWNFTFELLETCSRDQLNEKERFWIDMYKSNTILGLNGTKGNK